MPSITVSHQNQKYNNEMIWYNRPLVEELNKKYSVCQFWQIEEIGW